MYRKVLFTIVVAALCLVITGCEAPECQQMRECCAAVEDLDGLGGACADIAADTDDAQTCREVVRTIGYMLEDRDQSPPSACQW